MLVFKKYQHKRYRNHDLEIIKHKVHYRSIPIQKVRDVLILNRKARKALPKIKKPALVMQSSTDYQLDNKNAEILYKKLGSKRKRLFYVPDSYHVFTLDKNTEMASAEIYRFIKENS